MCIGRTYIEVHVRRILVQPLLVHHNKCNAIEQIKCPLILWNKELRASCWILMVFSHARAKTKKKSTVTVLPESIWIKIARTNVLGLAVVNINIVIRKLHFSSIPRWRWIVWVSAYLTGDRASA